MDGFLYTLNKVYKHRGRRWPPRGSSDTIDTGKRKIRSWTKGNKGAERDFRVVESTSRRNFPTSNNNISRLKKKFNNRSETELKKK